MSQISQFSDPDRPVGRSRAYYLYGQSIMNFWILKFIEIMMFSLKIHFLALPGVLQD